MGFLKLENRGGVALELEKQSTPNQKACYLGRLGRSPGEGNDYPVQYFYLENSMDRRA